MTIANLNSKFTGKSSIGFISNQDYEISFDVTKRLYTTGKEKMIILIETIGLYGTSSRWIGKKTVSTLRCEYDSVEKFLENWKVISIHELALGAFSHRGPIGFAGQSGTMGPIGSKVVTNGLTGSVAPGVTGSVAPGVTGSVAPGVTGSVAPGVTAASFFSGVTGSIGSIGISGTTGNVSFLSEGEWKDILDILRSSLRNNKLETILS